MKQENQTFMVRLFTMLSSCGMRQKLMNTFAFQPPQISYTMRLIDRNQKKDSISKNEQYQDFENIRVHKVSLETLNDQNNQPDSRKHKSIEPQHSIIQESKTMSYMDTHYEEVKVQDLDDQISYERYYKPKNSSQYQLHQLLLLDYNKNPIDVGRQENLNINGYFLRSKKGTQIASLFIEIQKSRVDYCLIFSHGNAADLGYMLDTYLDLAYNLNINVFAYEYSGYGQSTGRCSDISIIYDIKSAYKFLIEELGFCATKLIVYGYSIGSGPSVALTSLHKYPVGGLIIHSGISSGLRVINMKLDKTPYYDFFPNVDLIKNVQCPVFILHGTNDKAIGIEHARLLAANCKRLYQLWSVHNAGHFGIDTEHHYRMEYFDKMQTFMKAIIKDNTEMARYDLERRNTSTRRNDQNHYYKGKIDSFVTEDNSIKQNSAKISKTSQTKDVECQISELIP